MPRSFEREGIAGYAVADEPANDSVRKKMIPTTPRTCLLAVLALLLTEPLLAAPKPSAIPPAPIPIQVVTAKKVFLSNLGVDAAAMEIFQGYPSPDAAYNGFYRAMQSAGAYTLTATPGEADAVFEFQVHGASAGGFYYSAISLMIIDAKTHYVLWTLRAPLTAGKNIDDNVNASVTALIDALKSITEPATPSAAKLN